MAGRRRDPRYEKKDNIPGPAEYSIEKAITLKIKNEPAFSIGTSKREDIPGSKQKRTLPGPADYDTVSS